MTSAMVETHLLEQVTASDDCYYCCRETWNFCSCGIPLCGAEDCATKHEEENRVRSATRAA
jgi:hypothetical protein